MRRERAILFTMSKIVVFNPNIPFSTALLPQHDAGWQSNDYVEIVYVTQGSLTVTVTNGERCLGIGEGMLFMPHAEHMLTNSSDCTFRTLFFAVDFFKQCCDFLDSEMYGEWVTYRTFYFRMPYNDAFLFENRLSLFLREPNIATRKRLEKCLTLQLVGLLLSMKQNDSHNSEFSSFYTQCIDILNRCCTSSDYLEVLQLSMGYHKVYLCKKFKNVFGVTIGQYVKSLRLQYVEYMLKTTELSAARICNSAGFESFSHFNKIFKEQYGMTPTEYRNRFKK